MVKSAGSAQAGIKALASASAFILGINIQLIQINSQVNINRFIKHGKRKKKVTFLQQSA